MKDCDCGSEDLVSARYGHSHLAWCGKKVSVTQKADGSPSPMRDDMTTCPRCLALVGPGHEPADKECDSNCILRLSARCTVLETYIAEKDNRISQLCGQLAKARSEVQTNWDGGIEVIATHIEHLRDEFQSTAMPVKSVATAVRERFASSPLRIIDLPRQEPT